MKIDNTSFFVNSRVENGTETCSWGTSIGQSKSNNCRLQIDRTGVAEFIIGMSYCSLPTNANINLSGGSANRDVLQCALFEKVYVNGIFLKNQSMLIWMAKEHTQSHENRRMLCYAPYGTYNGISVNENLISSITSRL